MSDPADRLAVPHDDDCSIYMDDGHTRCNICDCGAFRRRWREVNGAHLTVVGDPIWEAWGKHQVALDKGMEPI